MTDDRRTDARLRELYARTLHEPGKQPSDRCPTPEAMLALVRGEMDEASRLATLDHVMSCAECSREFELLRAIDRASGESAGSNAGDGTSGLSAARRRSTLRRYAPLALAASLLIAAGVLTRNVWRESPDVTRGETAAVTLVAPPDEMQTGAPIAFVWRPIPDAFRYEIEVLDAAGNVAYAETTSDTVVTLPAGRLAAGSDYRWMVRATTGAGDQLVSAIRRLRIRRE